MNLTKIYQTCRDALHHNFCFCTVSLSFDLIVNDVGIELLMMMVYMGKNDDYGFGP